jgi:serine/threonine-protein kinase RsbW
MDQSFEMTIGSDIEEIPAVSARFEGAMKEHGFYPEEILDTQLAVEEVITNIILHGYEETGGEIQISCTITSQRIGIRVTDSAPPFDPLSIPEPDLEENMEDRKIGGLGVYLLRQVMDEISYRYEDGKNILTMVKMRTS